MWSHVSPSVEFEVEKRIGSESEGKKAREEEEGSKEKGTRWKYHWVIAHCAPSPAVFTVFSLRQSFQQLLNRSRTGIISFREKPLLFLLHPLVPLSVIILLIIISIRDGSKYYTFVSNSLINQISLWRGYDFLARSDRWKREEIEIDYPVADPWSRFRFTPSSYSSIPNSKRAENNSKSSSPRRIFPSSLR